MRYVLQVLFIGLLFFSASLSAQPGADFKEYEIGNIKVSGNVSSDENSIIAVSGLAVGDKIRVPGTEIQRAIKSLWDLRLFSDVEIRIDKMVGDVVILGIYVEERPRLTRYDFFDIRKGQVDDLKEEVRPFLLKGGIVTEGAKSNVRNAIEAYYIDKGFLDAKAEVKEVKDPNLENGIKLEMRVDKGKRIKIKNIVFTGNENVKTRKLRKKMKNTRRRIRIFAGSKLIKKEYEGDKAGLIDYYNTIGYRDANIVGDSIWREGRKEHLMIRIDLEENKQYYFRDITFRGNSIYSTEELRRILSISKGDVYNNELLDRRLNYSEDSRDITSQYMDNGYLFFSVTPVEKAIEGDSIDMEIRIFEGPQAVIDKVIINGNTTTHEHVIRRELRTLPGQKFSRSDIIRSQRQIINLGYFNPEALNVVPIPNFQRGTVDIEYTVEEKSSDQLELSAGWGGRGRGVIGTLGVTFNNFSLRNIFKKESWSPLPQGDGQRLSIRAQTNGRFFQSYNFSFTEPWLGGKKPNSFTTGMFYSLLTNGEDRNTDTFQRLGTLGFSMGIGTRLKVPDDYFVSNTTIGIQSYSLKNWTRSAFIIGDGTFVTNGRYNNVSLTQVIARNSISNPIFPTSGSNISLTAKFTLPYSLFRTVEDFESLDNDAARKAWAQKNMKWIEYHKWRLNIEWYRTIVDKLVFKFGGKFGYLGQYGNKIGVTPFERYEVGGDGIANQFAGIAAREIISMRGYETDDLFEVNNAGATIFNKLTVELRYPISLNPSATVFVLGFFEGGNAWDSFKNYNPLDLRRSAGAGVRVFLPMFGMLGFDYGWGWDRDVLPGSGAGAYGNFNIILGFEPE